MNAVPTVMIHHAAAWPANGKRVPEGFRVIFKDGNRRNFEPANLELATKEEISAVAFANYQAYPEALRRTIRLHRNLEKAIQVRIRGEEEAERRTHAKPKRVVHKRWTKEMDVILRQEYPTAQLDALAEKLATTAECSFINTVGGSGTGFVPNGDVLPNRSTLRLVNRWNTRSE